MTTSTVTTICKPFLKWAGGKQRLIPQYLRYLPKHFDGYHEPFLGGGAMFFHLQPANSVLSDGNKRLIETYLGVRDNLSEVIRSLKELDSLQSFDLYYHLRDVFNGVDANTEGYDLSAVAIYLNRACFNGLYRENLKGYFNTPIGMTKGVRGAVSFDYGNLEACSMALQDTALLVEGYTKAVQRAGAGNLMFVDPPYVKKTASSFASYGPTFDDTDQIKLERLSFEAARSGATVLATNSYTTPALDIWRHWDPHEICVNYTVNASAKGRLPEYELIFTRS